MSTKRFSEIQVEIISALEKLKVADNPTERRNLLAALRILISEMEKLVTKTANTRRLVKKLSPLN
jgi:hypothetical protein